MKDRVVNRLPGQALVTFLCLSAICCADAQTAPDASSIQTFLLDPLDAKRNRAVPLRIYLKPSEKPQPVFLFSHGLGGSRDNNAYLGNYWAARGYVGVFMQHRGSDDSVWKDTGRGRRLAALKNATGVQQTLDRFKDVPFVIDQLEAWNREQGHRLAGRMDLEHIGLCGHSYGAVTTLGLTGRRFVGRQTFEDKRIDAFLPLSPSPGKGGGNSSAQRAFGHLRVPILCMTGTRDGSPIDPNLFPASRREVYRALPPGDKYQLVFEGGEHFAFGDSGGFKARRRNPKHHPAIQKISLKFWDAYLKEDADAEAWLQSEAPRKDCNLHPKDVWEWK